MHMEEIFNKNYVINNNKIYLKVNAGAKQNSIDGFVIINDKKYLKISVIAIAFKGKANEMIIKFLADEINLPKSNITIIKGLTSSFKVLIINI